MSKFLKRIAGTALVATLMSTPAVAGPYGLGRAALPNEIAAWDTDVAPDGTGLPHGSGDVLTGEEIFADACATCHGDFAEGVGNWPKLAGGADTLADKDPLKTVGSYWPHLSTTWDYVNRSMPFGNAQTLAPDEVYAIVAYILYSNDLVDEDFVLSNENFLEVNMPNADGFIVDDRKVSEAHFWSPTPCMTMCKDTVEITMRAAVLDVTPDEEVAQSAVPTPAQTPATTPTPAAPAADPEMVKAGEKVFKKCKACHQVGDAAKDKTGPVLNGIVGASVGGRDGFKYSKPMTALATSGAVWNQQNLAAFLTKPKAYLKGTKMTFSGLKKPADIAAVTAYLRGFQN